MYEQVEFERDCRAIVVPDGTETLVPAGMHGFVTQVLGGNYTLQMQNGMLVRVDGRDADAIGQEPVEAPAPRTDATGKVVVDPETVWDQLRQCYDPEIPVNIVDLGLVYACEVEPREAGGYRVVVRMTLTAPGCGMGQVLRDDVDWRVRAIPGVEETDIDLVFDPPWGPDRMSEEARLELGLL